MGTALFVAGCGSSDGSTTPPAGVESTGASQESPPPTKAEARRYAEAVNLHESDFPPGKFEVGDPEQEPDDEEFTRCLNRGFDSVLALESADFSKTVGEIYESVGSEVEVLPSPADASQTISELQGGEGADCAVKVVESVSDDNDEFHFGKVEVTGIPGDHPEDEVALRIETALIANEGDGSIPLSFDIRSFAAGPAFISLFTAKSGDDPPSNAEEEAYVAILRDRASEFSLEGGVSPPEDAEESGARTVPEEFRSEPDEWPERWCEVKIGDSREQVVKTMGAYPTEEDSSKIPLIPYIQPNNAGENENEAPPEAAGSDTWETAGTYEFNAFFDPSLHVQQLDFSGPAKELDCGTTRVK
jgi:hypothetical protein